MKETILKQLDNIYLALTSGEEEDMNIEIFNAIDSAIRKAREELLRVNAKESHKNS